MCMRVKIIDLLQQTIGINVMIVNGSENAITKSETNV